MRISILVLAAALVGCNEVGVGQPHPRGRLYHPTGIAFQPGAGGGTLYVVSSNFDRRYTTGLLTAIDLGALGLPAFPAAAPDPVPVLPLGGDPRSEVLIRNFGGGLAALARPGGARLFVPSRDERSYLHVIEAQGAALDCDSGGRSCTESGFSLEDPAYAPRGRPRAPQPFDVTVTRTGQVYVTHLQPADEPAGTGQNPSAYLVTLDGHHPAIDASSFIDLGGAAAGSSVVAGSRYLYLSGRDLGGDLVVRTVEPAERRINSAFLKQRYAIGEARGLALAEDERRLYVGGRRPDTLLVVEVSSATAETPTFRPVRALVTPAGLNDLEVIPRPSRGPLVVATCSEANTVIIYDEEAGQIVANLFDVGAQPFAVAVDRRGAGARLYVTNFGDGQVAVVDIPDLSHAHQARVVARLGDPQRCLLTPSSASCRSGR